MDTLAHGLAGCVVGALVLPEAMRRHPGRVLGTAALLANLPDVDYAMLLVSDELWLFHHRGLTHCVAGLLLTVPAGVWIARRTLGRAAGGPTSRSLVLLALGCIALGHILLDYLTSFGLMLLYPFAMHRVGAALMFIIDPLFWLIGGVGAAVLGLVKWRSASAVRRAAATFAALILALWGAEAFAKHRAVEIAIAGWKKRGIEARTIHAYPMVTAPMVWTVVTEAAETYPQAVVSFWPAIRGRPIKAFFPPFPEEYGAGRLCTNAAYDDEARKKFDRYDRWGRPVACGPWTLDGTIGCKCFGLKYSVAANRRARFGGYWISPRGETKMLAPESAEEDRRLFESPF